MVDGTHEAEQEACHPLSRHLILHMKKSNPEKCESLRPLALATSLPTQGYITGRFPQHSSLYPRGNAHSHWTAQPHSCSNTEPGDSINLRGNTWRGTILPKLAISPSGALQHHATLVLRQGLRGQADQNINISYLLRAYPMPGIALSALYT